MQRHAPTALAAAFLALSSILLAGAQTGAGAPSEPATSALRPQVNWRPFSEVALREAAEANKLVLLYVSASWDYHDRIMSEITYADQRVVDLLSVSYVPIRVDTDQRPDLFARYGMGAWPTTAILLPNGHPMYYPDPNGRAIRAGGSFYPPADFVPIFSQLASYYADNSEMVKKISAATDEGIIAHRNAGRAEVTPATVEAVIGKILDVYGERPDAPEPGDRFPDFDMVALTFDYWTRKADRRVLDVGLNYLTDMGRGGIYDYLGGGFFRYAHDTRFIVPSFEKIPATNAAAIRMYIAAYEVTGNGAFLRFAQGTLDHVMKDGVDPVSPSFVGAMAAWNRTGDDGDYYTWTEEEVRSALTEEESKVAVAAFDIRPLGEMAETAPRRNVIFLAEGPQLLAKRFGMEEKKAAEILDSVRSKLLAARAKRPAPQVDMLTYVDWSGMMASAFFDASRTLHQKEYANRAVTALDILLSRCKNPRGLMVHVCRPAENARGEDAFLSDQAWVVNALLDAYEEAGAARFLTEARGVADRSIDAYKDPLSGGFTDRPQDPNAPGLASWAVRDLESDMGMAKALLRLSRHTGHAPYASTARKVVESWADEAGSLAEHGAPCALAAQMLVYPPLEIFVSGDASDPALEKGRERALSLWHPWRIIRHLAAAQGAEEMTKRGLRPIQGAQVAFCVEKDCAGPYPAAAPLRGKLQEFLKRGSAPAASPGGMGSAKGE